MSQIVNIILGPLDPNPGNYTIRVKDCDNENYITINTGLLYSDFPYQFDIESYITGICFDYQVIDMDSGCICTQQENIPTTQTPTPTNTPSLTTTPTNTNTPSVTSTPSNTNTPSVTNTPSNTNTPSITQTPEASLTPTSTNTPTQTPTQQYKPVFAKDCCTNETLYFTVPIDFFANDVFLYNGSCYTITLINIGPGGVIINSSDFVTGCGDSSCPVCPSVTPTITPSVTPSDITCQSFDFEVELTPEQPTPSTTPQPTPSPTTERFISGETVVFLIDNGYFSCGDIIKLQDCLDNSYYYVNGPIFYQGTKLVVNDIFTAELNGEEKCVKFVSETNGSSTHFIQNISQLHSSCCSNTPTPTSTPSVTLTPTPTVTPSTSIVIESVDLSFNVVYGSGSTVANYEIIASKVIEKDLEINFKNVLYDRLTNDEVPIYVSTVMSAKTSSVTVSTSIPYDYSRIEPYELSYKEIVTQGTNISVKNINRYNSVIFENYTRPTESNYQFISCCGNKIKNLQVDASSKWVVNGYGVIIDSVCYVPYKLGGDGSDGIYYGPDIESCDNRECPKCPSATPTTTPTKTPIITPTVTPSGNFYLVCDVVTKEYYMVCDVETGDYYLECSGTTNNDNTPTPTISTSTTTTPTQTISSTPTTTPTTTPSLISGDKTIYLYYPNL